MRIAVTAPARAPRIAATVALALMLAACGAKEEQGKRPPPLVAAVPTVKHTFVDRIEAVGTARANEQVTISATVTERLERVLFEDGMAVSRGQLLAVLSQAQEAASLNGAIAEEKQAAAQYQRINSLYERGFATRAQLDLQLAAAARARADAAEARAQIGDRMIRAPFAGYVGLRTISAGAVVNAGTPLVTISDLSRIKLDFTVPETRLALLRPGQEIEAISAAFPDQPIRGQVSTIDPAIDPSSRAVMVRAILPNPGGRIKPGMLLTVRVATASRTADAVPELAVVGEGDRRFVYVLGPGNKVKEATVTTGLRDGGLIEVDGVPAGARVISEGVQKLSDGMTVRLPGQKPAGGGAKKP